MTGDRERSWFGTKGEMVHPRAISESRSLSKGLWEGTGKCVIHHRDLISHPNLTCHFTFPTANWLFWVNKSLFLTFLYFLPKFVVKFFQSVFENISFRNFHYLSYSTLALFSHPSWPLVRSSVTSRSLKSLTFSLLYSTRNFIFRNFSWISCNDHIWLWSSLYVAACSKSCLNIWNFTVHVLLKPRLQNLEHFELC